MQRMGGGGNNPSCGCDMQAGWPPASEFPRGGLQGGGNWNFNEFNLALTKNGRTRHLRGRWNANNNRGTNNSNNNRSNNNRSNNNNNNNNGNQYQATTPLYEPTTPPYPPTTPLYEPTTPLYGPNTPAPTNKNKTNKKKVTSAPNGYSNLAYKGKKYYKKTNSGEVFEITKNGSLGKSMGFYVTPKSGKPYLTQMPPPLENETLEAPVNRLSQPITPVAKTAQNNNSLRTQLPPNVENGDTSEDYESEAPEGEKESTMKSLSQNGGRRRRHSKKKTHKRNQKKRQTRRRR